MREDHLYIPDDFEAVQDIRRELGTRENVNGHAKAQVESEWEALSKGKTIGKAVGVQLVSGGGLGTAGADCFELRAPNDALAIPFSVLLSPPRANPNLIAPVNSSGPRDVSSGQTNDQFLPAIVNSLAFGNPFARISWGMGGINNTVDIDIHQGAMLTLNGSFVRIQAFIEDPPLQDVGGGTYLLSAFVGPGRDKGIGGQRTIMAPSIPAVNAETAVRATPFFARRVTMCGIEAAPAGGFAASIRFFRDKAKNLKVAEYFFGPNGPLWMPVPNGGYYFAMCPQAAALDQMNAIFDLAI